MRISDWSSDVCSSDLALLGGLAPGVPLGGYDAIGAALGAGLGLPPLSFNNAMTDDLFEQKSRNFAFFTHNIFEITDRVNLTLGLRYTNEKKTIDATPTDHKLFCQVIANRKNVREGKRVTVRVELG